MGSRVGRWWFAAVLFACAVPAWPQEPGGVPGRGEAARIAVTARTLAELRHWDAETWRLERAGDLRLRSSRPDCMDPDRTHEILDQYVDGVRVLGAEVRRQRERQVTVSIGGVLYRVNDAEQSDDDGALQSSQSGRPPATTSSRALSWTALCLDAARAGQDGSPAEPVLVPTAGGDVRRACVSGDRTLSARLIDVATGEELPTHVAAAFERQDEQVASAAACVLDGVSRGPSCASMQSTVLAGTSQAAGPEASPTCDASTREATAEDSASGTPTGTPPSTAEGTAPGSSPAGGSVPGPASTPPGPSSRTPSSTQEGVTGRSQHGPTLAWDANTDGTAGYLVMVGMESRKYSRQVDVGPSTTWPLLGLQPDVDYFLAVIAYNASGAMSQPSMEVRARLAAGGGLADPSSRASAAGNTQTAGAASALPPASMRALALEATLLGPSVVPQLSSTAAGLWRGLVRVIDDPGLAIAGSTGDTVRAPGAEGYVLDLFARLARALARDGRTAGDPATLLRPLAIRAGLYFLPVDADEDLLHWAVETAANDLDPTGRLSELVSETWESHPPA